MTEQRTQLLDRTEAFVRAALKPGTDEAVIKSVTEKIAKAMARTLKLVKPK